MFFSLGNVKIKNQRKGRYMSNYYEYSSLAKRMYEKIEDTLTKVNYEKDKLITLKEIREILKENRELLWYYPIQNENGVFYLQGMKTMNSSYLHLEVSNPCLPEDLFIYFDLDIATNGMSINTRNEYLNLKVQRLLKNQYLAHHPYANPYKIPDLSDPLNQIAFRREHFYSMEQELKKIKTRTQ